MGKYVRQPSVVENLGRKVELRDTLSATREQLRNGEELCAVAERRHGKVALVLDGERDFQEVSRGDILALYAIGPSVLEMYAD